MSTYEETFLALFKPFSILRFGFHKRFFFTLMFLMNGNVTKKRVAAARLGPAGEIKADILFYT